MRATTFLISVSAVLLAAPGEAFNAHRNHAHYNLHARNNVSDSTPAVLAATGGVQGTGNVYHYTNATQIAVDDVKNVTATLISTAVSTAYETITVGGPGGQEFVAVPSSSATSTGSSSTVSAQGIVGTDTTGYACGTGGTVTVTAQATVTETVSMFLTSSSSSIGLKDFAVSTSSSLSSQYGNGTNSTLYGPTAYATGRVGSSTGVSLKADAPTTLAPASSLVPAEGGEFAAENSQTTTSSSTSTSSSSSITSAAAQSSYAQASSSSATASSASASSSGSSSGPSFLANGKRGAAYNTASLCDPFGGDGSLVSWAYNWASSAGTGLTSNLQYIPFLWGTSSTSSWDSDAQAALDAGSTVLLGFNEPDLCVTGSACISVSDSVSLWQQYMDPYASKATLGSPAVTNGETGTSSTPIGLDWLGNFTQECSGCSIDFLVLHWYSDFTDQNSTQAYFQSYFEGAHARFPDYQIWITEFGLNNGEDSDKNTFLEGVLAWVDEQEWIGGVAWFMVADDNLVSDLTLSTIGETYNTYTG